MNVSPKRSKVENGYTHPDIANGNPVYFDRLPDELLEIIFAQLPVESLNSICNRVCTRFNRIISSERFVPWKKKYHKLKRMLINPVIFLNEMGSPADYLVKLIRYMKEFKPITAGNMIQCLERHKKYNWAKALMQERVTDCLLNEEPNPWCCITVLVIISQTVYDIQEIIQCLLVPTSQCTSIELLECLYCIATFLYAFKTVKSDEVWNGLHYRLFYALYLYENSQPVRQGELNIENSSPVSMGEFETTNNNKAVEETFARNSIRDKSKQMTHEQTRIVNYDVQPGDIIKIVAFAGTGKTSTLVTYTKMRPNMRFLMVVYNKSVSEYAKTQFPINVECRTGHSLAYGVSGIRYKNAGKLYDLKVHAVTQALPKRRGYNLYTRAKFVMDTVKTFIASADPCITTAHVPNERMGDNGQLTYLDSDKKEIYAKDAQLLWTKMMNLNDKSVTMSHDGYLKVYQLSKPTLWGYDCILIDEAQDMSPALADILLNQPQAKILVGDPHQQIYAFRGAVNAMGRVSATNVFYLTQSFRFGPEIAQIAMCCLETLKREKKKTLVGNGKKCEVTGSTVGQVAIICRTNATVFDEAVKICRMNDDDIKVGFVGGADGFGFDRILDIYILTMSYQQRIKEHRVIEDRLISKFKNMWEFEKYANNTLDCELLGKIKIVKTYSIETPVYINKILSKCVTDLKDADFVLSTAHKAKGLEFSTVKVTDDYGVEPILKRYYGNKPQIAQLPICPGYVNTDEGNLLYVAVTRAKHALLMSPILKIILELCGERFEHPVPSHQLQEQGIAMKCRESQQEFKPYALTIQKEVVKLSETKIFSGGVISPQTITNFRKELSQLYGFC
ncbi:F-box DNA helicase 1-like [Mytilus edulis]|uniref:F-box DNA helicase 1-like n=1 Tax=Mytilus edulis TaxID=6550 RepID=UPI0039F0BD3C